MRIFDTHCHLADPAFDGDLPEVIARMREAGVCRANVVCDPCEEIPNVEKAFDLAERYDFLTVSVGVHPHNASRWSEEAESVIREKTRHPRCVLLGEIGLDYHYDFSPRDAQRRVFEKQLEMAYEMDVPAQLHIREAHEDATEILGEKKRIGRMPRGIVHCFTGTWAEAEFYLSCGFYVSFSGAVTFKNAAGIAEAAKNVPEEKLLIETDCPYMSPVPLRGKRNEPAYIARTLEKVALLRGENAEAFAARVYENSRKALGVKEIGESDRNY